MLYGLTYFPTGAIVAAPTTSLPEAPGGSRNWDYRYTWVRDASFTLQALWVAACPHEANKFFDYLADAAAAHVRRRRRPADHVRHRGRARPDRARARPPVRLARTARRCASATARGTNGSSTSTASCSTPPTGCPTSSTALDPVTRRFLADLADIAAARWQEADQGIWEVRGEPRHFLYSKLMCWVALDRAIALADRLDAVDRVDAVEGHPGRDRRRDHDPRLERATSARSPSRSAATSSTPRPS